jgi:hypothetical protein
MSLPPRPPPPPHTHKHTGFFRSQAYNISESAGAVEVAVVRVPPPGGQLEMPLSVYYNTQDGDAIAGRNYKVRTQS